MILDFIEYQVLNWISDVSWFFINISGIHNVKLYSYKELRNATDDFSQANKIGEGGFGSVYKVN